MKFKLNPILGGILYSSIFGVSFLFTKLSLLGTKDIFHLLSIRFLIGFLFIEILRQFSILDINIKNKRKKPIIFISILQPIIYYICEAFGISLTSTSQAGIMMAFLPILTLILSKFILNENSNYKQILFIIVSMIGVLIINLNNFSKGISFIGVIILFCMVLTASLFNVFSRKYSSEFNPEEITYMMMIVGFMFFTTISIFKFISVGNVFEYFYPFTNFKTGFSILFLGIFSSVIAFLILNYVLKIVEASRISIFSNFTTFVAIIAGIVFLKEEFTIIQGIGSLLILLGVWGVNSKFALK